MLPGIERLRDLPAAARRGRWRAGADAHGARLGRGSRRRASTRAPTTTWSSRSRSRSCSRACARWRGAASWSGPACSRSAICDSTRRPAGSGAGTTPIQLSAKEFALLETFMRRPDEVLSRLHLLEHAWDFAYENRSNVDRRLRPPPAQQDRRAVRPAVARDRPGSRLPAAPGQRRLSRLPIRLRVAAAFAVAMAAVLVALGRVPLRPPGLAPVARPRPAAEAARATTWRCSSAGRARRSERSTAAASSSRGRATRRSSPGAGACWTRPRRSAAHPCSVPTRCGGRWPASSSRTAARCRASTSRRASSPPTSRGAGNASCSSSGSPARTARRRCEACATSS